MDTNGVSSPIQGSWDSLWPTGLYEQEGPPVTWFTWGGTHSGGEGTENPPRKGTFPVVNPGMATQLGRALESDTFVPASIQASYLAFVSPCSLLISHSSLLA